MVRTKNANKGKAAAHEVPLDELFRKWWPEDENDSSKQQWLKRTAAKSRDRFVSRWVELEYPMSWNRREVVPGKPPKIDELCHIPGFEDIIKLQGWHSLFSCLEVRPDLVKLFFANMIVHKPDNSEIVTIRSYVKGVDICLLSYDVNEMFQLDCDCGFPVSGMTKEEYSGLLKEAYRFLCNAEEPDLNAMSMCGRAVSFVICQFIQGRAGKELTDYDYILTYKAMTGEKIDFGDVFFHNLVLTKNSSSRKLPYGGILSAMFEMLGVDCKGQKTFKITQFFGRRNLSSILGKRKNGGDEPESSEGITAKQDEPEKNPPASIEEISKQLHNIQHEQSEMKATLLVFIRRQNVLEKQTTAKLESLLNLLQANQSLKSGVDPCTRGIKGAEMENEGENAGKKPVQKDVASAENIGDEETEMHSSGEESHSGGAESGEVSKGTETGEKIRDGDAAMTGEKTA